MKKLAIILLAFIVSSCGEMREDKKEQTYFEKEFSGKHTLRSFKVRESSQSSFSASYFLIFGGASGSSEQMTKVRFAWKMNSGTYAISEIEANRIRVAFNDTIQTPYITFYSKYPDWDEDLNSVMDRINQIGYITVYCKEEDFPMEINLNQL